jgi:hypothetical protein
VSRYDTGAAALFTVFIVGAIYVVYSLWKSVSSEVGEGSAGCMHFILAALLFSLCLSFLPVDDGYASPATSTSLPIIADGTNPCQLVTFVDFVEQQNTLPGIAGSVGLTLITLMLSYAASIPNPTKSFLGVLIFALWVMFVLAQYGLVLISLVAFVRAAASSAALFSGFLVEWKYGFKRFNVLAIMAGGFQPFVLSCLFTLSVCTGLLVEAFRVWKVARGGEDKDKKLLGITSRAARLHFLWPAFNVLCFSLSLSSLFSVVFVPSGLLHTALVFFVVSICGRIFKAANDKLRQQGGAEAGSTEGGLSWAWKLVLENTRNATACFADDPGNGGAKDDYSSEGGATTYVALSLFAYASGCSSLVTLGTLLAMNTYSGASEKNVFIREAYEFQFMHPLRLEMPLLDMDIVGSIKCLDVILTLPSLSWGPDNFTRLGRQVQTLSVMMGLLKLALAGLTYFLALVRVLDPSVPVAEASKEGNLQLPVSPTKRTPMGIDTLEKQLENRFASPRVEAASRIRRL